MLLKYYPYTVKNIEDFTDIKERTIQNITLELVKIVPYFAVKDENGKWRYSRKAFIAFGLIDLGIVKNSVEMTKYKTLELIYGVPVEFSLAITKKER